MTERTGQIRAHRELLVTSQTVLISDKQWSVMVISLNGFQTNVVPLSNSLRFEALFVLVKISRATTDVYSPCHAQ